MEADALRYPIAIH